MNQENNEVEFIPREKDKQDPISELIRRVAGAIRKWSRDQANVDNDIAF